MLKQAAPHILWNSLVVSVLSDRIDWLPRLTHQGEYTPSEARLLGSSTRTVQSPAWLMIIGPIILPNVVKLKEAGKSQQNQAEQWNDRGILKAVQLDLTC